MIFVSKGSCGEGSGIGFRGVEWVFLDQILFEKGRPDSNPDGLSLCCLLLAI
jgi:hypothetical protein